MTEAERSLPSVGRRSLTSGVRHLPPHASEA